ncbi:MAG: hypothetical protein ACK55Z_01160, partial [bacterium]
SSSIGEGAVGAQDGATSEKTTFPEPPARSRTEILGLDEASSKGSGTPGRRWKKNPVQIAASGSGKSSKPTSAGEARRQPDAETGDDDGGDDTRHVTGPRLQHRCGPEKS